MLPVALSAAGSISYLLSISAAEAKSCKAMHDVTVMGNRVDCFCSLEQPHRRF
jgi:hypothetical protein